MVRNPQKTYRKKKLKLSGEIVQRNAHLVQKTILDNIDESVKELQIDMKEVEYLDSTGIGIFILAKNKMAQKNGTLSFINLKKEIVKILKLAGLEDFFKKS